MTIAADLQSLSPTAMLVFFEIDLAKVGGGLHYFHAGTNELNLPVVWQGNTYTPAAISATDFETTAKGALPRPKIQIVNTGGLLSAEVAAYDDLIGCKVTRRRTYAKYLDAVNFVGGNPTADPNQFIPDDVWYVERKMMENRYIIEWELVSAFDLQGVMLPYRQVVQNSCPWQYRSSECGYTDTRYYDANDNGCALDQDFCAKRLSSCKVRFPAPQPIPFGGFPGVVRY